jgi:hypothetical protein
MKTKEPMAAKARELIPVKKTEKPKPALAPPQIPVEKLVTITPLAPGTASFVVDWKVENSVETGMQIVLEHIMTLKNGISTLKAKALAEGKTVDALALNGLQTIRRFKGLQHERMSKRFHKLRERRKKAERYRSPFSARFVKSARCLMSRDVFERIVEDAKKATTAPATVIEIGQNDGSGADRVQ